MTTSRSKSLLAVGFLTVVEHGEHGLFGGYLLVNATGRPLEFHCTVPVRVSRAQEILYGASLKPYLYGEQIGPTLMAKAKTAPAFVCTDLQAVLAVREVVSTPVAWLMMPSNSGPSSGRDVTGENASPDDAVEACTTALPSPRTLRFTLADRPLAIVQGHERDETVIRDHWQHLGSGFDLHEPFERIREAIEEAKKSARAA